MGIVADPTAPGPNTPPNAVAQTGVPDPPSAITLAPVGHTDTTVTYEVSWSTVEGADDYDWWVTLTNGSDLGSSASPQGEGVTSTTAQFTVDRQSGTDDPMTFHVRGENDDGEGNAATHDHTVPQQGTQGDPPPMPSSLSLDVTVIDDENVRVDADWSSVDGVGQYEWSTGYDTGENEQGGITEAGVTSASETMPRSGEDEGSYFCVKAANTWGDGESNCDGYTVSAQSVSSAPSAPSNPSATAGDGFVEVGWTDNSNDESGFKIHRSTSSGLTPDSGNLIGSDPTVGADVEGYTDSGLTNGTTYYYKIAATNSSGDSSYTSEVSATPQASGSSPSADLVWSPDDYTSQSDFENDSDVILVAQDNCNSGPCMELDETEGVPNLGTDKSIKCNYGDGEKRLGLTIWHANVWEVWYEVWVKFDADFDTNWDKDPPAPDYKFIFGLIENDSDPAVSGNSRWSFRSGTFGCYYDFAAPGASASDEDTGDPCRVRGDCDSYEEWDGEWHRYRLHCKSESAQGAGDGKVEVWIANESGGRNVNLSDVGVTNRDGWRIRALGLGRNINQRPDFLTPLWFGQAKVWTSDPGW